MDVVKVVILGASSVGKTSIVRRFIWNEYAEKYSQTEKKQTYYTSIIINDHVYELILSDLPVISYFPTNSYFEWSDYRFYGLRHATAYILVFDLSNVDTFQYVRMIREQIMDSRDMKRVPLLIVGNKQDLVIPDPNPTAPSNQAADVQTRKRRDIINLVRKHWKCIYVECSARYNWGVIGVFKELMEVVDTADTNRTQKEVYSSPVIDNIHEALDNNKCSIV